MRGIKILNNMSMKRFFRYFLQGLLYIAPMVVTVYFFVWVFTWLDGLFHRIEWFENTRYAEYNFPGLGILLIVLLVAFIGFLGQRLIATPLANAFENLLNKAPFFNIIYTSVKDLLSAFVGQERKFETAVLVKIDPEGHIERMGFVTNKDLSDLGIHGKVSVYLPSSYGMLGELIIVDRSHITVIDANSADVMKFIVSGGVTRVK